MEVTTILSLRCLPYLFGYKMGFALSRMTINFAIIRVLPFLNNPKDLDPSYKMDLDFWIVLEGEKLCPITEEIR